MNARFIRVTYRMFLRLIIIFVMASSLFPLIWMISTSLKPLSETMLWPPTIVPRRFTTDAFITIFTASGIFRYFMNTAIYTLAGTAGSLLFSTLAGYVFAKCQFKGRTVLFTIILATMMIPGQITLIPIFITLKNLKLINTLFALIIPGLFDAFSIFLIRQFAFGIPDELFDAARIDGAGELFIFAKVFVPLCMPPILTLTVLGFMGRWNDLFWPLLVAGDQSVMTLQLALNNMVQSLYQTLWNELAAAMLIAMLPVLALYIFFQRYFTQGIVLTGLKG